jgi:type I restriction enzyme, S subunit
MMSWEPFSRTPYEWLRTTISELIDAEGGSIKTGPFGTTLKASEYSIEGVPLISVREIGYGTLRVDDSTPRVPPAVTERLPEYLLRTGDVVFGRKGAIDRSAHINREHEGWFLGSDGIRLRLPETCDSRFIAYQIQSTSTRNWLIQHATGTTMASLNQGVIERVPIVSPPLDVQRAIAHILGTLDDKIELNRRMNETLEEMARAIFKSWFVVFDPVCAKAEGRDPGLRKHIADLFPDRFEDSELGEIPAGWEVDELGI